MGVWKAIYDGDIGMRHVRVDRRDDSVLRVSTIVSGTAIENQILGETPGQLKDRLIEDGEFTESQASDIIDKIIFR